MKYRIIELSDSDARKWDDVDGIKAFIHNALNPEIEVITRFNKNGRAHSFDGGETYSETIPNPRKDGKSPTVELKPIKTPPLKNDEPYSDLYDDSVAPQPLKGMGLKPPIIKSSKDAEKAVKNPGFIPKSFSARKKK